MNTNTKLFIDACTSGDLDQAIKLKSNLRRHDHLAYNNAAFIGACKNGHIPVVKYLLSLTPKIPICTQQHRTFRLACINNDVELAEILCDTYIIQNPENNNHAYDMLFYALILSSNVVAEFIINKYRVVVTDGPYKNEYDTIVASMNRQQPKSATKV